MKEISELKEEKISINHSYSAFSILTDFLKKHWTTGLLIGLQQELLKLERGYIYVYSVI
jgi:hypothetical protein